MNQLNRHDDSNKCKLQLAGSIVYRNQPKHYRTVIIRVFSKQQSSTDLHAVAHNSGKLNAIAKFRASHYGVRFALPTGTVN